MHDQDPQSADTTPLADPAAAPRTSTAPAVPDAPAPWAAPLDPTPQSAGLPAAQPDASGLGAQPVAPAGLSSPAPGAAAPHAVSVPRLPPIPAWRTDVRQPPPRPPRRKPRTLTVVTAICTVLAVGGGAWAMLGARAEAVASMIPGPTAATVLERFVTAARSGSDDWRDDALPTLVERYAATDSVPLTGERGVFEALGAVVETTVTDIQYESAGTITDDLQQADRAAAQIRTTYRLPTPTGDTNVTTTTTAWLTRPFYYGDDTPTHRDPDRTPTAVGPWAVMELTASADPTTDLEAQTECGTPLKVLIRLSESARTDGTLSTLCSTDPEGPILLSEGLDAAALATAFPVLGTYSVLPDAMAGTVEPDQRGVVQLIVPTDLGDMTAVIARSTHDAWVLIGIAAVTP